MRLLDLLRKNPGLEFTVEVLPEPDASLGTETFRITTVTRNGLKIGQQFIVLELKDQLVPALENAMSTTMQAAIDADG